MKCSFFSFMPALAFQYHCIFNVTMNKLPRNSIYSVLYSKPKPFMKRIVFILGVSIIMALLTVTATLFGWWLGASLPLDISDGARQIVALLTASACTWVLYFVSRKVLARISVKPY